MPMVTLFQTMDVTNLVRWCRKRGWGFHMLMCWCIGCAAAQMEDFSSGAGTEKKGFRTVLPLSFQFHHTQMDGMEAAQFLDRLQKEMQTFSSKTKGTEKQV